MCPDNGVDLVRTRVGTGIFVGEAGVRCDVPKAWFGSGLDLVVSPDDGTGGWEKSPRGVGGEGGNAL
jgi:hypothetical protein